MLWGSPLSRQKFPAAVVHCQSTPLLCSSKAVTDLSPAQVRMCNNTKILITFAAAAALNGTEQVYRKPLTTISIRRTQVTITKEEVTLKWSPLTERKASWCDNTHTQKIMWYQLSLHKKSKLNIIWMAWLTIPLQWSSLLKNSHS